MIPMYPLDPVEQRIHWNQWIQYIHDAPVDRLVVEVSLDGYISLDPFVEPMVPMDPLEPLEPLDPMEQWIH